MKLRSKVARAAVAGLVALLATGLALAWSSWPRDYASSRYYYTQEARAGIDLSIPFDKQRLISSEYYDTIGREARSRLEQCDLATLANAGVSPVGASWHGIGLCNAAGLSGDAFTAAHEEFKRQVDEERSRTFFMRAEHMAKYLAGALAVWGSVLALAGVLRWIKRGE